jgi:hypothetical protein
MWAVPEGETVIAKVLTFSAYCVRFITDYGKVNPLSHPQPGESTPHTYSQCLTSTFIP